MLPPSTSTSSFLPVSTLHITYPEKFETTSNPVQPGTKVAWTKKERAKATKAPVMASFEALKHEVGFSYFIILYFY